jgi:predicted metal-dependent phosphotriesterase family hydrolase
MSKVDTLMDDVSGQANDNSKNQYQPVITTVTGPIAPAEIGFCHSHEHLFLKKGQAAKIDPALQIDDFDKTVQELNLFKEAGGTTIVDAQPVGSGRHSQWLTDASQHTGVQIVAATGFHKLIFYPENHWIRTADAYELSQLFIDELQNGMYTDGEEAWPQEQITAKAGIIKTASDFEGVGGPIYRLFKAAAQSAITTGAPIMSHTEMGRAALDQIKLYTDFGLAPNQLIICHLDRKMDNVDYMLHVASTGVYLELDTIGRFNYHSDEEEVKLIIKLIEAGYENQILLGLDTTRKRLKSYGGTLGLDYLAKTFLPKLEENGVSKALLHKMMHENPAKAFSKNF